MVRMPDGINLYTRVMLPAGEDEEIGSYPVIFHRSPYEPGLSAADFTAENIRGPMRDFIAGGYAVINQHCRGTGQSEGVFRNMQDERGDGLSTLDWIRSQPWYGGEIYLYGASYKAFVHSAYISAHPADVRGAVLSVMPSNMFYVCYERTTFKHDLYTMWFTRLYMKNQLDANEKFAAAKEALKYRPLMKLPERIYGHAVPELTETFLRNREDDPLWCSTPGFGDSYDAPLTIDFPLLLIGGYYDIHFRGILDYWDRLNPAARAKSSMLIGPWGHAHNTPPEHETLFPSSRRGHPELEWFDHIRLGRPLSNLTLGEVTYYTAGEGWRHAARLAEDSDGTLILYPTAEGGLDSLPSTGSRSYKYNPNNPAAFPGGANVFQSGGAGQQPQPPPDFREDVLSFVSEPFSEDVTIDGCIRVRLEVSSDCADTAFFVRADAERGGIMWYIRDTIVSLRDELGTYVPGTRAVLDFTLDPVAWVVRRGERLRFDVSSSNFPTYNAHSNTAVYWADAKKVRTAHNTVYMENSAFIFHTRD